MLRFPTNIEELSNELLTDVLQLHQPGIEVTDFSIVQMAQCGDGLASTADRIILKLTYGGTVEKEMPEQLMLKTMLLAPHAPSEMYENEVRFYAEIRPELMIETPKIYASAYDSDSGQFGVIMEDLNVKQACFPNATSQVSVDEVKGLLRTLAKLHGSFWQSPRFNTDLAWIVTPVAGGMSDIFSRFGFELIKDQVEKNQFKQDLIAPIGIPLAEMWQRMRSFQHETLATPQTLLHGDTHVANTYLLADGDGGLFDWQLMVRGNWAHDVSYIIVTALSPEDRREHEKSLLALYLEALGQNNIDNKPSPDEAWYLYRRSIMWGLVIGWLITPPVNYGETITSANIVKLVTAVQDLNSFES